MKSFLKWIEISICSHVDSSLRELKKGSWVRVATRFESPPGCSARRKVPHGNAIFIGAILFAFSQGSSEIQ